MPVSDIVSARTSLGGCDVLASGAASALWFYGAYPKHHPAHAGRSPDVSFHSARGFVIAITSQATINPLAISTVASGV